MKVGFGLLRLPPDQFWSMTLRELEAAVAGLFGDEVQAEPLARADLEELMQRFPDSQ